MSHENGHAKTYEVCCQGWKLLVSTRRPAVFDPHVLPFEIAPFAEALTKRGDEVGIR